MVITLSANDSMKARSALAEGVDINNCNCKRLKKERQFFEMKLSYCSRTCFYSWFDSPLL